MLKVTENNRSFFLKHCIILYYLLETKFTPIYLKKFEANWLINTGNNSQHYLTGAVLAYWPGMYQPYQRQLPRSCWSPVQTYWWPWPGPGWSPWMTEPPHWLTDLDQPPPCLTEFEPPGSSFHWRGTTQREEQCEFYIKELQQLHSQC